MIAVAKQRAQFYVALATALDAGLTLEASLTTQQTDPIAQALLPRVIAGNTLSEAIRAEQEIPFQDFESTLIQAGEESGRLPSLLKRLARHFELRAQSIRRVLSGILYPLLVLHGAFLLPPLFYLFRDGIGAYLRVVLPPILCLWALLGICYAFRSSPFLSKIPGLGKALKAGALARFAEVFSALQAAGATMPHALEQAAKASAHEDFSAAGLRVAEAVRGGSTVHEGLAREAIFPQLFTESVHVGETAGRLEETLERAAKNARQESETALKTFAATVSAVVYFAAVIVVAFVVITFFSGYAETLSTID